MRDFRLPSRREGDLRSSGMLHGVASYLFTEVSEQPISPIFKQETGPLRWDPQIVSKRRYQATPYNIPEEGRS